MTHATTIDHKALAHRAFVRAIKDGPDVTTRILACADAATAVNYADVIDKGPNPSTRLAACGFTKLVYGAPRHDHDEWWRRAAKTANEYAQNIDLVPTELTRTIAMLDAAEADNYAKWEWRVTCRFIDRTIFYALSAIDVRWFALGHCAGRLADPAPPQPNGRKVRTAADLESFTLGYHRGLNGDGLMHALLERDFAQIPHTYQRGWSSEMVGAQIPAMLAGGKARMEAGNGVQPLAVDMRWVAPMQKYINACRTETYHATNARFAIHAGAL